MEWDRKEDWQLIQEFLTARRDEAFTEIVRRYAPLVLGVCRRILGDRFTKYFARVDERGVEKSARYSNVTLQPVLRVEHSHVELFDREILKLLSKDLVDVAGTSHRYALVAFFRGHSAAKLQRRVNSHCAGIANTRQTRE